MTCFSQLGNVGECITKMVPEDLIWFSNILALIGVILCFLERSFVLRLSIEMTIYNLLIFELLHQLYYQSVTLIPLEPELSLVQNNFFNSL